ncbi:ROK family protein [Cellulosimicrobium terreum]|nr:ROK family protein [Cellulosimicrobium terreum]
MGDDLPADVRTLSVDCGGGGIKANVLDASGTAHATALRVPTPYPLPPQLLVETIADIAARLPRADRVTVGMPGMIRRGVVVHTPHYVTRSGPRSHVEPDLVTAWSSFDVQAAVAERLGIPALVLNDAEVHGAGVIAASGLELVLTLGTGLGSALFHGGRVAPHLEWSRAPVRRGTSYDAYVGEPERRRLGSALWSRRVLAVVDGLRPVFWWDRLYLGGGNSRRITPGALDRLGDDVVVVPNSAALVGGARAWDLPAG